MHKELLYALRVMASYLHLNPKCIVVEDYMFALMLPRSLENILEIGLDVSFDVTQIVSFQQPQRPNVIQYVFILPLQMVVCCKSLKRIIDIKI